MTKPNEFLKLKRLIKIAKNSNIYKLKYDNIEIEFNGGALASKQRLKKYEQEESKYLENPAVDMPPDDVMLFAATPHFDEMIKERVSAQKKG